MMVYTVSNLNYCSVAYYCTCPTHALRICYNLSTHYATYIAMLRYDTLLFLIRTVFYIYKVFCVGGSKRKSAIFSIKLQAGMFGGVNVWQIAKLKVIGEIKFGK